MCVVFFFKQKTAYEMRISDWSSDVCSSDLALQRLLDLGLHDAFRLHHDDAGVFSWWDYRQAAFRRNLGLRIDLTLVSEALRARCSGADIDREPRTWERPSDHAPAWVELDA